jgi:hypothetical protein
VLEALDGGVDAAVASEAPGPLELRLGRFGGGGALLDDRLPEGGRLPRRSACGLEAGGHGREERGGIGDGLGRALEGGDRGAGIAAGQSEEALSHIGRPRGPRALQELERDEQLRRRVRRCREALSGAGQVALIEREPSFGGIAIARPRLGEERFGFLEVADANPSPGEGARQAGALVGWEVGLVGRQELIGVLRLPEEAQGAEVHRDHGARGGRGVECALGPCSQRCGAGGVASVQGIGGGAGRERRRWLGGEGGREGIPCSEPGLGVLGPAGEVEPGRHAGAVGGKGAERIPPGAWVPPRDVERRDDSERRHAGRRRSQGPAYRITRAIGGGEERVRGRIDQEGVVRHRTAPRARRGLPESHRSMELCKLVLEAAAGADIGLGLAQHRVGGCGEPVLDEHPRVLAVGCRIVRDIAPPPLEGGAQSILVAEQAERAELSGAEGGLPGLGGDRPLQDGKERVGAPELRVDALEPEDRREQRGGLRDRLPVRRGRGLVLLVRLQVLSPQVGLHALRAEPARRGERRHEEGGPYETTGAPH